MSTKKKLFLSAAGAAGGEALNVEDVFSTYLYEGNGTSQTITNGIDLDGEGGLVWVKSRSFTRDHVLVDTERGVRRNLKSNTTAAQGSASGDNVNAFYSSGFLAGPSGEVNNSSEEYASWTFRKAPKFFDVVTYTGSGGSANISHNLDATVGTLIIKRTDASQGWYVYHRGVDFSGQFPLLRLDQTAKARSNKELLNSTEPTSTQFSVASDLNTSGGSYVAYLFAHNDGDGEFGPDGDQDIIKCGSYTGNGSSQDIDLGFEPQWVLFKNSSYDDSFNISHWTIYDNMRGVFVGGDDNHLRPNTSDAEQTQNDELRFTATGFSPQLALRTLNASGDDYIYIAIRRGPMAVPESATDVFDIDLSGSTAPRFESSFPVDMAFWRDTLASQTKIASRLTGKKSLLTNDTSSEDSANANVWDFMDGFYDGGITNTYAWMWRRAPSFCDVVAYTGNGLSNVNTISHNLGVAPEMIWTKRRDSTNDWQVYHSGLNGGTNPEQYSISLNKTQDEQNRTYWNDTAPTSTTFQVTDAINGNGDPYIAYLFASLAGVSKVGSYTSNGSQLNIDCGFSSGARFVLIKRTSGTGGWFVWDSERGITASNDPYLQLQATDAEATDNDTDIEPYSSGFTVNYGNVGINNLTGETYIFYAIA
jgi:hypothetical protein